MGNTALAMPYEDRPSTAPALSFWDERYLKKKYMWGLDPSPTAEILSKTIEEGPERGRTVTIIDVGCGYGRDVLSLAERGHNLIGVDLSEEAIRLAYKTLDQRSSGKAPPLLGSARFLIGTIGSALAQDPGKVGAIYSHRALHLFNDDQVKEFVDEAARRLRPGGILCVSARSPKDFNSKDMKWVKNHSIAEYKDRPGHVINFWGDQRFQNVFSGKFDIQYVTKGNEMESEGNPVNTVLNIMLARRRADITPTNGR